MMQGKEGPSVGEIKLAWAYELLSKGFAEIAVKFAHTDQNAAWGMLATINGQWGFLLLEAVWAAVAVRSIIRAVRPMRR